MHIEISAGGLSGGIAVSSFQSGMKKYISGTDGMISSFKAVRTATYNLNGGVDRLAGAVNQVSARERTEESRKSGAENVQSKANSFLDLAVRVDKQVASMVKQDRKELYGKYPSLKPSPGQWIKDRLSDAWNWLCKAGKDIANAAQRLDNLVYVTLRKIGDSIVTFWREHKQEIITSLIIIGTTALIIAALIGSGGLAAPALATAIAAFFHISMAAATKIALTAVAVTIVSAAMNLWSTWGGAGSDSWLFQAIQTTLNVAVAIITTFSLVAGTFGLGMSTLIKDGITKVLGGKLKTGVILKLADTFSKFIGYSGLGLTTVAGTMNVADAWFNINSELFDTIQSVLSKTAAVLVSLYGIGLIWDSMKKVLTKNKTVSKEDIGKKNKVDGTVRENHFAEELKVKYPEKDGYSVLRETYLRDQNGNIVKDPVTGTGRRVDMMVVKDGEVVNSFEVTSKTANKTAQTAKELRIREAGGNFIKDKSGKLIEIPKDIFTEIIRRD